MSTTTEATTFVFLGDSITDAGRTEGRGDVDGRLLGDGYVWALAGLLRARGPERDLRIVNAGVGGSTSEQMLDRLPGDLAGAGSETWVTILIGINDCNAHLRDGHASLGPEAYEANLRKAVGLAGAQAAGVMVLDPFLIATEATVTAEFRPSLEHVTAYVRASGAVARDAGAVHVATHEVFAAQLAHRHPGELGLEAVHPSPTGHLVLANAWLEAMGL